MRCLSKHSMLIPFLKVSVKISTLPFGAYKKNTVYNFGVKRTTSQTSIMKLSLYQPGSHHMGKVHLWQVGKHHQNCEIPAGTKIRCELRRGEAIGNPRMTSHTNPLRKGRLTTMISFFFSGGGGGGELVGWLVLRKKNTTTFNLLRVFYRIIQKKPPFFKMLLDFQGFGWTSKALFQCLAIPEKINLKKCQCSDVNPSSWTKMSSLGSLWGSH